MSDWVEKPLGQLARIVSGGTPSRSVGKYWENGSIPWVTPSDITATAGKYISAAAEYISMAGLQACSATLLPVGAILMTSRATLGEARISTISSCTNQGFKSLIPLKGVSNEYLYYQLQRTRQEYARFGSGSTFLEVGKKDTYRFPVRLPDLLSQRKIASILSLIDVEIEATETLIAKQEQVRQGLMQDLFTRGVDAAGELRPTHEEAPDLYCQGELGWMPKDWTASPLLRLVPRAVYGISTPLDDDPRGVPVLRMNNIQTGQFDVTDIKYSASAVPSGLTLKVGDVLFNRTNSLEHVGKAAIWKGEVERASFASYLVRLDPEASLMTPAFLCHWLNRPETQRAIRYFATPGVHQVNINPTNLRRTICAHPTSTREQEQIVELIDSAGQLIAENLAHVGKLGLQKSGLMQDLLTGRVSVAPLLETAVA